MEHYGLLHMGDLGAGFQWEEKYRLAVKFLEIGPGCSHRMACRPFLKNRKALSSCPAHISLPLYWASKLWHSGPYIFCRNKTVENTFLYR
jgi:hypothetical protein